MTREDIEAETAQRIYRIIAGFSPDSAAEIRQAIEVGFSRHMTHVVGPTWTTAAANITRAIRESHARAIQAEEEADRMRQALSSVLHKMTEIAGVVEQLEAERDGLRYAGAKDNEEMCQALGRVLGQMNKDAEEAGALRDRLADILTRTAAALKGPPPDDTLWSWHDLPEIAAALRGERAEQIAIGEKMAATRYEVELATLRSHIADEDKSVEKMRALKARMGNEESVE